MARLARGECSIVNECVKLLNVTPQDGDTVITHVCSHDSIYLKLKMTYEVCAGDPGRADLRAAGPEGEVPRGRVSAARC